MLSVCCGEQKQRRRVVGVARKPFQQPDGEPRFADSRFTGEQHHLTFAAPGSLPSAQKQLHLFITTG